ncbi:MAG: DUF2167 domain-containing protein [Betaproteobacteria bacterium]
MKIPSILFSIVILMTSFASIGAKEANPVAQLKWQTGPNTQSIDGRATLNVPEKYYYLDEGETKKYSDLSHNPSSGNDSLFTNGVWEAYLNFDEIGYVKDNETIDPDDLLKQYQEGVKASNDFRREKGWGTLEVEGWFFKPQYDKEKKLLEWAFLLKDSASQKPIVNYYTKILGRTGAVSITLVATPENMSTAIADFKDKLNGFDFNQGERYTEFKQGDKVAEYGLAALIVGGVAAVAAKKGFFAVILAFLAGAWKLLLIPFIFAFGWLKSLFNKKDK